ncbi:MAG TPA: YdcF family protein [Verrucomicrobiae bacterium]|nr:YdcF family protein [Verrucomicrobiae bacterium]
MHLPLHTASSASSSSGELGHKFFGLLNRKPRWGFSWKGWLTLIVGTVALALTVFFNLHSFLAVTQPVDSKLLVAEGWVHDFTFEAAAKEFNNGRYISVFATGGPIQGQGGYISDSHTYASIGADKLVQFGVPAAMVHMVPSRVMARDRTYGSAVALRSWIREQKIAVTNLNVLTEDAHARRTWLLFQKALGPDVKVGIISIPSPDYDAKHWWRYSEAAREVIDEGIAYIYARFLFRPAE